MDRPVLRIFISYGHDEFAELARHLKKDLQARGHECWFDEDRLKPGGDWEDYILEGLEWCGDVVPDARFLLLMTDHSVRRPEGYCRNELALALIRNLPVIPVKVTDVEPPLSIIRIQWLDMEHCFPVSDNRGRYERQLDVLLAAVEEGELEAAGDHALLLNQLKPLDFGAELAEHVPGFIGREWLTERIMDWLESPGSDRVCWISGSPGTGKTAFAAYLAHERPEVVAYHLCRRGHQDKADARRCVMSLAYQMAAYLPELRDRLFRLDLREETTRDAQTLFHNLIVSPLSSPTSRSAHSVVCMIDALDEATIDGRNELAQLLVREWDSTPDWMRLIVTSRPDPEVAVYLQSVTCISLDEAAEDTAEDMRRFFNRELAQLDESASEGSGLVDTLVDRSEGAFLYADRLMADLREKRMSPSELAEVPTGLRALLYDMFQRQFPDVRAYQQHHRPLLEMIAVSRGPLPLDIAQEALNWGAYDCEIAPDGTAYGDAIDPLGSLFTCFDGAIRPFHSSVVEWLMDGRASGEYRVSRQEGHRRLAEACWSQFEEAPGEVSDYVYRNLPAHLVELQRWNDLAVLLTSAEFDLPGRWTNDGSEEGGRILEQMINRADLPPHPRAILATHAAKTYSHRGEYSKARRWLDYALETAPAENAVRTRAVALHERGSLALYERDPQTAAADYNAALKLCFSAEPPLRDEAAANHVALATIAAQAYEWDEVLEIAGKALREAEAIGDVAHTLAARRLRASALGESAEEAKEEFHAAIAEADSAGVDAERCRLRISLGYHLYARAAVEGDVSTEAIDWLREAMEIADTTNHFYSEKSAGLWLARCHIAGGNTEAAHEHLARLPETVTSTHPDLSVGRLLGLGLSAHIEGDGEEAARLYEQTVEYSAEHDLRMHCATAHTGLGGLAWDRAAVDDAEDCWQKAEEWAQRSSPRMAALTRTRIERFRSGEGVPMI